MDKIMRMLLCLLLFSVGICLAMDEDGFSLLRRAAFIASPAVVFSSKKSAMTCFKGRYATNLGKSSSGRNHYKCNLCTELPYQGRSDLVTIHFKREHPVVWLLFCKSNSIGES